jgi:hypothetical protein
MGKNSQVAQFHAPLDPVFIEEWLHSTIPTAWNGSNRAAETAWQGAEGLPHCCRSWRAGE